MALPRASGAQAAPHPGPEPPSGGRLEACPLHAKTCQDCAHPRPLEAGLALLRAFWALAGRTSVATCLNRHLLGGARVRVPQKGQLFAMLLQTILGRQLAGPSMRASLPAWYFEMAGSAACAKSTSWRSIRSQRKIPKASCLPQALALHNGRLTWPAQKGEGQGTHGPDWPGPSGCL